MLPWTSATAATGLCPESTPPPGPRRRAPTVKAPARTSPPAASLSTALGPVRARAAWASAALTSTRSAETPYTPVQAAIWITASRR